MVLLVTMVLVLSAAVSAQEAQMTGAGELLPSALEGLDFWLHVAGRVIEVIGIGIIVLGAIAASLHFLRQLLRSGASTRIYDAYRANLGRAILLGLEFLVAADIIGTVAVDPTLYNLGVLAVIVLIRTFLSFSLEVEIQGHWPWQHGRPGGAAVEMPQRESGV
jgi:uncharacterized membrane protein